MKICWNYVHAFLIACCRLSNHLWHTYRPPLGCVYPSRHFPIYDEKIVLNFPLRQCQFGYGVSSLVGQKKLQFCAKINLYFERRKKRLCDAKSQSAKILFSKSISNIKNHLNLSKHDFHLKILSKRTLFAIDIFW